MCKTQALLFRAPNCILWPSAAEMGHSERIMGWWKGHWAAGILICEQPASCTPLFSMSCTMEKGCSALVTVSGMLSPDSDKRNKFCQHNYLSDMKIKKHFLSQIA